MAQVQLISTKQKMWPNLISTNQEKNVAQLYLSQQIKEKRVGRVTVAQLISTKHKTWPSLLSRQRKKKTKNVVALSISWRILTF